MEETLKERFEAIIENSGINDYPPTKFELMCALEVAYNMALPQWVDAKKKLPEIPEKQYRIAMRNKNKPDGMIICDTAVFNSEGEWIRFDSWEDVLYWRPFNDTPPNPKD